MKNVKASFDYPLLIITSILVFFGTIMVFSSSVIMAEIRYQTPYLFVFKHLIYVIIGSMVMFSFINFDYHKLQDIVKPLILITVFLLILVLLVGNEVSGAKRWIRFGPFMSFQVSELAKLVLIIAIADYVDRKKSKLKNLKSLLPALSIIIIFSFLIALQPDLGTPTIIITVGLVLLFLCGNKIKHLVFVFLTFIPLIIVEIMRKPYRLNRIQSFISSWGDINSEMYQLNQSILAMGSGGMFGKGLAQGQMKLLYLPEPHTDFIFPIIGEEIGFMGLILLISLFLFLAWRGWKIAGASQDLFGQVIATGITLLIIFQAMINMGVACGLLPVKGLPLPFVSFGGTSLLFNLIEIGILLNISRSSIKNNTSKRG